LSQVRCWNHRQYSTVLNILKHSMVGGSRVVRQSREQKWTAPYKSYKSYILNKQTRSKDVTNDLFGFRLIDCID
jgi:hypothetical protein